MSYQLASFTTSSGIDLTSAYLRITNVQIEHKNKQAIVSYKIYATKAAYTAGSDPVSSNGYVFDDTTSSNLFTNNFACALGTDPLGTQPTDVHDILQCQAYLALKNHPSLTTLLTGATAV
jgi:hypothetical protein